MTGVISAVYWRKDLPEQFTGAKTSLNDWSNWCSLLEQRPSRMTGVNGAVYWSKDLPE